MSEYIPEFSRDVANDRIQLSGVNLDVIARSTHENASPHQNTLSRADVLAYFDVSEDLYTKKQHETLATKIFAASFWNIRPQISFPETVSEALK